MLPSSESAYAIKDVSTWVRLYDETKGQKNKIWLIEPPTHTRAKKERHWLFKDRAQGGDDWAERVACEVAKELQLPCPRTELARRETTLGVMSLDFTENFVRGDLLLGNELLFQNDPNYPRGRHFRGGAHTIDKVLTVLSRPDIAVPEPLLGKLASAADLFLGYLMFDVLIGNTDRHHENWGILLQPTDSCPGAAVLAPSFDHAASLGQILRDDERERRLTTKDKGYQVGAYVEKARSALLQSPGDVRPLTLMDALITAGRRLPQGAKFWQSALSEVSEQALSRCVGKVPDTLASYWAKLFADAMLLTNRQRILEVRF
jgi:hypothetical protein